jgi:hypothetical protein
MRETFLEGRCSAAGFMPTDLKMQQDSLDVAARFLCHIWDSTVKFGKCNGSGIGWEILHINVLARKDAESMFLLVRRISKRKKIDMVCYNLSNGICVLWDKEVSYKDAVTSLVFLDDLAEKFGLVEGENTLIYSDPSGISFDKIPRKSLEKNS